MEKSKKSGLIQIGILFIILVVAMLAALLFGSVKLSISEVISGFFGKNVSVETIIMRQIRLPRMLAGLLAGMGLALSGTLLQRVTDNGMASPNIIGVNAGAGFVIILMLYFFPAKSAWLSLGAFAGAMVTTLLIVWTSHRIGMSKVTIVLAGLVYTTLLNAGISFVSLLDTEILAMYNHFSVGSLGGIHLDDLIFPAIFICGAFIMALICSPQIKILCLGDDMASALGVHVKRTRLICLICASASAAAVVCFAGLLGFVGLIVPHIARRLTNGNMRTEVIGSVLSGGILVLLADVMGRVLLAPTEIPVGIVLAIIGAPFFLVLLIRRKEHA